MTLEEAKKAMDELKSAGHDEDEILASFYEMFKQDELDVNTLEALTHVMGYELTDEFKNMSPEDQKTKGYEEAEEAPETPAEPEVDEKAEAKKLFGSKSEDKAEEKSEDEDTEENKAKKLFEGKF